MQALAALSMLLIGAATLAVGVRLLLVARRTHQLPELSFGVAFVSGSLGSALAQLGQRLLWKDAGSLATFMNGFCFGLLVLSSVLLLVATWRIFRPREAWAQGACIGGSAIVCLVFGLRVASGELAVARIDTPAMGLFFTCRLAVFGWITFEALRYHGMLKRRLELGLADPLVTQQIFLWGISGPATLGATATITLTIFGLGRHPVEFPPVTLALTLLAVTSAGAMWCAFFPPRALRRRVEAGAS